MPISKPTDSEDEAAFVKRAHWEIAREVPDADERNALVFQTWREHHGESDEEKRAHSKFGDDEFAHIENVPVFKEHEYPRMLRERDGKLKLDDEGQPVQQVEKYDFDALKAICANLNHRIADTGDFSPISDKHSPRKGTEESKPRIFGYAGPFGLGQVGNKDPKWAIVAKKEHWFKDKAHLAREFSRRSPEVYLGRPMEDRILDPITALGADTPALEMGIHYSQDVTSGELVACYSGPPLQAKYAFEESKHNRSHDGAFTTHEEESSMDHEAHMLRASHHHGEMHSARSEGAHDLAKRHSDAYDHHVAQGKAKGAGLKAAKPIRHELVPKANYDAAACMPGSSSVAPPTEVEIRKKKQYAEDIPSPALNTTPTEGKSMISPEDATTIIQALMETEPMKWVVSQMEAAKAPVNEPGEDQAAPPKGAPPVAEVPPAGPPNKEQLTEESAPDVNKPVAADAASDGDGAKPNPKDEEFPMATDKTDAKEDKKPKDDKANYSERDAARDQIAKYAALEQEVNELKAQRAADVKVLTLANRRSKLEGYRFAGYDIDVADEMQRCSLERMSEETFQDHLDVIVKHYQRIPVGLTLDTPDRPLIEDRHAAVARTASNGSKLPDFVETEEFRDAVVAYAQAEQNKPEWSDRDTSGTAFYSKCRQAVIEQFKAKLSGKPEPAA